MIIVAVSFSVVDKTTVFVITIILIARGHQKSAQNSFCFVQFSTSVHDCGLWTQQQPLLLAALHPGHTGRVVLELRRPLGERARVLQWRREREREPAEALQCGGERQRGLSSETCACGTAPPAVRGTAESCSAGGKDAPAGRWRWLAPWGLWLACGPGSPSAPETPDECFGW